MHLWHACVASARTYMFCMPRCLPLHVVSACHNKTPLSKCCKRATYVVASAYSFATHFTASQQETTLATLLSLHYPNTHAQTYTHADTQLWGERLQACICHKLRVFALSECVYVCVTYSNNNNNSIQSLLLLLGKCESFAVMRCAWLRFRFGAAERKAIFF